MKECDNSKIHISSNFLLSICLRNISFKEHLSEDGLNRWPKHVVSYAVYNTINLHTCICTSCSYRS